MTWLALAALLAQDDLETWVRRLGADEVEVREEAHRRLSEAGASARRALLDKRDSDDAEVQTRARAILQHLDEMDEVEAASAVPRVTCEVRAAAIADVLGELSKQTKLEFDLGKDVGGSVTLSLRDVPAPEAFDRLCEALGDTEWQVWSTGKVCLRKPEFKHRPTILHLGPASLVFTGTSGSRPGDVRLWFNVQSLHASLPWRQTVVLDRVVLSNGDVVHAMPEDNSLWIGFYHRWPTPSFKTASRETDGYENRRGRGFSVPAPPSSGDLFADVEGAVELAVPVGDEEVKLEAGDMGRIFTAGDMTYLVESWSREEAVIRMAHADFPSGCAAPDHIGRHLAGRDGRKDDLTDDLFRRIDLRSFRDDAGRAIPAQLWSSFDPWTARRCGDAPLDRSIDLRFVPCEAASVAFKLKPRTQTVRLPFKVDRIPLP